MRRGRGLRSEPRAGSTVFTELNFLGGHPMAWIAPDFEAIPLGCEVTTYAYTE